MVQLGRRFGTGPASLADVAMSLGARLLLRQVSTGDGGARHDPLRLAAAFRDLFAGVFCDVAPP